MEGRIGKHLSICIELNKQAQAFQYSLNVHNEYLPEVVCSVLYARVLSTFQASILLTKRGMKFQVQMLVRCILEPFFPLIAISKSLNFVNTYVLAEEHERLKSINRLIRCNERIGETEDLIKLRELALSVKKHIDDDKIKPVSTYDCAVKAGLVDYYETIYSLMSDALHASPRSLQEAFELDPGSDKITAIKNEPDLENADSHLTTLADCLLQSISAMSVVFGVEEPLPILEISKRLHEIQS